MGSAFAHQAAGKEARPRASRTSSTINQRRVPSGPDAFLPYPVESTNELVAEIQRNATLRSYYARHFNIPQDRVVDFVRNALIPYRLPEAREVTAYGVTKSGHIYPVRTRLRAGTRVWATRSGLPVLRWACANPLTKNLPGTLLPSRPRSARNRRGLPEIASAPSPVLGLPGVEPVRAEGTPEVAVPAPVAVDTSALLPAPTLSGGGTTAIPFSPGTPPGSHGPGFLPFLFPIAGIVIGLPHGGGDNTPPPVVPSPTPTPVETPPPGGEIPTPTPSPSTPVVPPVIPPVTPPGNPVPEPGTVSLLAMMGIVLLSGMYFRARR